jgi:hypothetical protein
MTVHTKYFTAPTGSVIKALPFPSGSLANYGSAVQATEASAPNLGRFSISLNDETSMQWYLFIGSTTPSSWDDWYQAFDLSPSVDSDALATSVSNLVTPTIGTSVTSAVTTATSGMGTSISNSVLAGIGTEVSTAVSGLGAQIVLDVTADIGPAIQLAVEEAVEDLDLSNVDLTNALTVEKLNRYFQTNLPKVVLADTVHGGPNTQILEVGEDFRRAD